MDKGRVINLQLLSETELHRQLATCRRLYPGFHSVEPLLKDLWKALVPAYSLHMRAGPSAETVNPVLNSVTQVLVTHNPNSSPRVQQVAKLLEEHLSQEPSLDVLTPSALMNAYSKAVEAVSERDLLSLMTTLLGVVLFGAEAKLQADVPAGGQAPGATCPACGLRPHYAAYSFSSGTKVFECPLCYTQWQSARMKCPYCDNVDPESLGYFSVEGMDRCLVHFCSRCLTYHKVFDLKEVEGENHSLYLHHLASLLCDTVACREGFSPCSRLWWNDASALNETTDGEELL